MGRFKGNDATRGLSGNIGDFYNYRQVNGKTVASRQAGKREKPASAAQEAVRERFLEATLYGKGVQEDPVMSLVYEEKAGNGKSVYNLAVSDFCVPPVVKRIITGQYQGQTGDKLLIRAVDDFKVSKVKVSIYAAVGTLLEEGEAVLEANKLYWEYIATEVNSTLSGTKITATATDLPGNTGTLTITL